MFSFSDILSRIKSNLRNQDNRIEGSWSMDNAQAVSQELAMMHSYEIAPILDNISLDTAIGNHLDRKAVDFNMIRNPALPAEGIITITGKAGQVIPMGAKVQSDELTFAVSADCTLSADGTGTATVICDTAGSIGNIAANKIDGFTVASNVHGVIVTNTAPFSGGVDVETDAAFRRRILEKIQRPITSGNANHYVYWAKQVSGVSDAKCIGCWAGAGTVKVILFSSGGETPTEIVSTVKSAIERDRPIGAEVTVVAATAKAVTISCQLTLWDDLEPTAMAEIIKTYINTYLNSDSNPDKTFLSYHKVSDLLFAIEGITDVLSYTINGATASIQAADDEFLEVTEVIVNAD